MRARALNSVVGAVVGAALLTACPLFGRYTADDGDEHDRTTQTDPAAYAEQIDAKLRRYSACRDVVASLINESWERYTDQVGADGKPKRRREGVYLRGISDSSFRGCRRSIAGRTGPSLPVIEQTTVELLDAASRYAAHTRELDEYIGAQGWKHDSWAALAQIDPLLRSAHEDWLSADHKLQQAIDLRHIENDQLLLGVLEHRVSRLELVTRKVMVHARPLVRCLDRETEPTYADCRPLFDAFDQVEGEFEEVHDHEPDADKVFWMSTFAADVAEFHEIAGELIRKLGQRKLRPAELQPLRDAYSSLVRDAETLDFEFP
jgi:hypothetical protein